MYYFDTNILVYLFTQNLDFVEFAKNIFQKKVLKNEFTLHEIVLSEFYSIITNPKKIKNPLSINKAQKLIQELIKLSDDFHFLNEIIIDNAMKDIHKYNIKKYQIYDHLLAYSIKHYNLKGIITANKKDFEKYEFISEIISPSVDRHLKKSKKNFIPYGKQSIDDEDIQSVINVLNSDFITQGPKVKEFEDKLAEYCGAKYAVTFNSGTSALHGVYFSLGLKNHDEFITTPMTFAATSNAGLFLRAKPVFVDIESDTGNIDVSKIEQYISKKTKLISVVHYSGHPVDMEQVKKIADKYNLKIVEDACHALGAKYKNEKIGNCTYSNATVFSFHPVKHITTGEGGAVLTNDEQVYERLLMFRSHGITKSKEKLNNKDEGDWYYEMHYLGYNYRITDIQCALGISQLKKLQYFVEKRRKIANYYNNAFNKNKYFDLPVEKDYAFHSYHLYPIRLKNKYLQFKKEIFQKLRKEGIGVQIHYISVYWHPYYKDLGYEKGLCPEAENFYQREISLPLYPAMSNDDIEYVITKTINVFTEL